MIRTGSYKNLNTEVAKWFAGIEVEMKRIGYWSMEPLPEAFFFEEAFEMDTMVFSQRLKFILIPRVQRILEEQGSFPGESMVGAQARREFDGDVNANR